MRRLNSNRVPNSLGEFSADTVDALTGKRVGRPASATFRTLDVVGLDVMS